MVAGLTSGFWWDGSWWRGGFGPRRGTGPGNDTWGFRNRAEPRVREEGHAASGDGDHGRGGRTDVPVWIRERVDPRAAPGCAAVGGASGGAGGGPVGDGPVAWHAVSGSARRSSR